ncbi:MAG: sigma-54 dependent transcriptional regulator [Desulfosudaceae bacterium]
MTDQNTIMVVDDNPGHRSMLKTLLEGWDYTVIQADDGTTAVSTIKERSVSMILMDVKMVHMSGVEALERIQAYNPSIPVIMMTAYSSVEMAVDTLKKGAYDYLTKPLDFEKLKLTIERIMEHRFLQQENKDLRERLGQKFQRENIVGTSPAMIKLLEVVEQAAPSDANILITGESGTGKELVAGALHFNSPRKDHPFVKLNCAAITETLLESELFGHERGAFTGAEKNQKGKFVQAHEGSILLDEIGEMPLSMQTKLLRVLQEKEVSPVGSEKTFKVNVRVIASTNKSVEQLMEEGQFREDLFFRINVVHLHVPPLRQRIEDIPVLAHHFLELLAKKNDKQISGLTPDAMDSLLKYHWPGNVRELINTIERAVVLTRSEYLSQTDFPLLAGKDQEDDAARAPVGNLSLAEIEKEAIIKTLEAADGNRSEAARRLGITRKTLLTKLKQYGQD